MFLYLINKLIHAEFLDLVVKLKDKTLTDVYNYLNIGYI